VTIAKIAADLNKPNGQFECPPTRDDAMKFMKDLPVRKVPGVRKKSPKLVLINLIYAGLSLTYHNLPFCRFHSADR
jgi:nucleotidyltransferase/DNA polymerase involved in DNA repair